MISKTSQQGFMTLGFIIRVLVFALVILLAFRWVPESHWQYRFSN